MTNKLLAELEMANRTIEHLKNNNKTLVAQKEETYRIANKEYEENQSLKDRIEKAIEYINKIELDNYDIYTANILLDRNDDLLEILKGDK